MLSWNLNGTTGRILKSVSDCGRFIHSTNRANKGYQLAVNHLADRTPLELRALRGKQRSTTTYNGGLPFPYDANRMVADVPSEFDWRLYGAVTPVKGKSQ